MRGCNAAAMVVALMMAAAPAGEFNMDVTTAGIQLGPLVSGPALTPASLAHRIVLLEFWGVHCPPCIASMPKLEEAHRELASQGLVVIGAHAQGGSVEDVRKTAADLGLTFTIVADASVQGGDDFGGIPHCMLFDHAGKCVYRGSPFQAHDAIVAAIKAAPSSVLEGRRLEKLAAFNEALRDEASFGQALRKAASLVSSSDEATAEEARFVVEKIEAHGRRMLESGVAMKEANPLGATELMQRCSIAFKGSDVGTEAAGTLREWRKDPEFQKMVKASQQLAKLQVLRANVLRTFGDALDGNVTPEMAKAVPTAMRRQMADVIRGIQKIAPGSEMAAVATKLAEEFAIDVSAAP
ncbi:MAG: TlpA family protein disulfide reductase [Pirellulales bacterium]